MSRAMNTPWGPAQSRTRITEGISFYYTAGHGGIHLSQAQFDKMPDDLKALKTFAGGRWYEEDEDIAIVAVAFPKHFALDPERAQEAVKRIKARQA